MAWKLTQELNLPLRSVWIWIDTGVVTHVLLVGVLEHMGVVWLLFREKSCVSRKGRVATIRQNHLRLQLEARVYA
jgi:hypothetical protein